MACVYILTNPTIPGLLKIGYTARTAHERCREVSQGTGVPVPYAVLWSIETTNTDIAHKLEQRVHAELSQYRFSRAREFFECTEAHAIDTITTLAHRIGAAATPDLALLQRLREAEAREAEQRHAIEAARKAAETTRKAEAARQATEAARQADAARQEEAEKRRLKLRNLIVAILIFIIAIQAVYDYNRHKNRESKSTQLNPSQFSALTGSKGNLCGSRTVL